MEARKSLHNAYKIVKLFEEEVAEYTGAPFAVSIDNCTNALFLCLMYAKFLLGDEITKEVRIPSKTYLSVPQSIIHAGFEPVFDYSMNSWSGLYQLKPLNIYDSAKIKDLYREAQAYQRQVESLVETLADLAQVINNRRIDFKQILYGKKEY